jgi:hypothetical protein
MSSAAQARDWLARRIRNLLGPLVQFVRRSAGASSRRKEHPGG